MSGETANQRRTQTASDDTPDEQTAADTATADWAVPSSGSILASFVRREVSTVMVTPGYFVLCFALVVVTTAVALVGGGVEAGYLSTVVDLLTPMQLLVPIVAVALGYTAVLGDTRRGELDVFRTYPVRAWHVVVGVYLGRVLAVAVAVGVPLVLLLGPIAVTDTPRLPMYATHSGVDSPFLYLRMVVLTLLFALVMVAVAVAISALVSTTRAAIAAAGIALFTLLVGLDLGVAFGFSLGLVGESGLTSAVAVSPLGAYRGLVLETAVVVTEGTGPQAASPLASTIGLLVWGVGALLVATLSVR